MRPCEFSLKSAANVPEQRLTALLANDPPLLFAYTWSSAPQVLEPSLGARRKVTPTDEYVLSTIDPGATPSLLLGSVSKSIAVGNTQPIRLNEPVRPPAPTWAAYAADGVSHDARYCSTPRDRADANPSHVTNGADAFANGVMVSDSPPSSTLNNCAASCSRFPSGTSTQIPTVTSVLNRPTSGDVLKR